MKKNFVSLLLLFVTLQASAQNLSFKGFLPAWNQTGKISNKINYNLFVSTTENAFSKTIANTYYPAQDLQLYIQPGFIYNLKSNFNIATGYAYQRDNPFKENYNNEHRLWQQCMFLHGLNKARMTHRLRFEERFIERRVTHQYPLTTRLRYLLGCHVPLSGEKTDPKEFYLHTYNECYFSLSETRNATYSENWSYLGVGYYFGKMGKIETGYLLQVAVRNKIHDIRMLNLLQVTWITHFDLFKRKAR
jgi:hypothetical protein